MNISISTRQAYSEIIGFLNILSEKKRNEIPRKLIELFEEEKDKEYIKIIDSNIPIKDQNLKEETLAIIAILNLEYWCKDEQEKQRLKEIYSKNEEEYQKTLHDKYSVDNLFKNNYIQPEIKKEEPITSNEVAMVEYKESIIKKIINKIKNFFK